MRRSRLHTRFFTVCLFLGIGGLWSQISPDCSTAIPICNNTPVNGGTAGYGLDDFGGAAQSGCLEPTTSGFIESNSAWYRFRTGASGQLGFNIAADPSEDWDFALYRASDCGSLGDPVRCNFFDNRDQDVYIGVGESPTGNPDTYQYEPWLQVEPGEEYFLMINNFSNTNSGFSIQFSGQIFVTNPYDALDCSIIDNLLGPPVAACEGETIVLDADTGCSCTQVFEWFADTGSGFLPLAGETASTLAVTTGALYRVRVSLPDGSQVISDVQVGFSPAAMTLPVSDASICSGELPFDLGTKDPEALGPQDPDAFRVSYHLSAADAQDGVNPLPAQWDPGAGLHTVFVRTTSLQNPDCFDASVTFALQVTNPPILNFVQEAYICSDGGSIAIGQTISDPAVTYLWDDGQSGPLRTVSQPGLYTLTAESAGGNACMATRTVEVIVSVAPAISEIRIQDLQASNRVTVVPEREGRFEYALDDGPYGPDPVFEDVAGGSHVVRMRDFLGCGEIQETITVVGYPPFFTPNGDGQNDLWQVTGLETLTDPVIHIFDRYGKLLKQLDLSSSGWDGTYKGRALPATDYWFRLTYRNSTGERVEARHISAHFALKR